MDHWRDEAAFGAFRRDFAAEFEALDSTCADLTRREAHLGDFELVGQVEDPDGQVPRFGSEPLPGSS